MTAERETRLIQDRIQENARKGQSRTETHLADHFWLLSRSVDVRGEDLLVERRRDSELEHPGVSSPQCFGLIQAKFFEGRNPVRILRSYVEDMSGPRRNFFAFLHSDDSVGEHIHYFFSAKEILDFWRISSCEEFFEFRITNTQNFESFLNRSRREIRDLIHDGISQTRGLQSRFVLSRFFRTYVDVRMATKGGRDYTYLFRIVEGCHLVFHKNSESGSVRLLEPRRDLFEYSGDFSWGYRGTGPQFLTMSLLGHLMGGKLPSRAQYEKLLNLIADQSKTRDFQLTSAALDEFLEFQLPELAEYMNMF